MIKVCKKGHRFEKKSDCETCPKCEAMNKPKDGIFAQLSAPARRALINHDIHNEKDLTEFSEKEILLLHGIGKTSIPILRNILSSKGLSLKK